MLVDGHVSHFYLVFLKYICDENHRWTVFFGVPYGESLWQVGYSTEQNRTYKINIVKANNEILTHWIEPMTDDVWILPTYIIPLINKTWINLFAEVESNKKVIVEHGWFPYNQNLLMQKQLCDTMTMKSIEIEKKRWLVPLAFIESTSST